MNGPEPSPITADSLVADVVRRYPRTGPIFTQRGRLFVARPRELYASYPAQTVAEWAALNRVALEPLLRLLNRAAEAEEFCRALPRDRRPVRGPE